MGIGDMEMEFCFQVSTWVSNNLTPDSIKEINASVCSRMPTQKISSYHLIATQGFYLVLSINGCNCKFSLAT